MKKITAIKLLSTMFWLLEISIWISNKESSSVL